MTNKKAFTLLEVMVALVILGLISGVVGVQLHKGIEEKRFQTSIDRFHTELFSARRLAINMQADWILTLRKEDQKLLLRRFCPELGQEQRVQWEAPFRLFWNREEIHEMVFHFAATGKVSPKGTLELMGKEKQVAFGFPQLFHITEN